MPALLSIPGLADGLLSDGTPSFAGGQVSNQRANLLQPTQSSALQNCDQSRSGRLTTRRGTIQLGDMDGTYIQGLYNYQTPTNNYLVAANGGRLWAWQSPNWNPIANEGVSDNAIITFYKPGAVNNGGGYVATTLTMAVDGFVGVLGNGDTFTIPSETGTPTHTITAHTETAGNITSITFTTGIAVGGVADNAVINAVRIAQVNNAGGYPGGFIGIDIDTILGTVNIGDTFRIGGEMGSPLHTLTGVTNSGGNTRAIVFTPGIANGFQASDSAVPVPMVQGVNKLYISDITAHLYSWDGTDTVDLGGSGNAFPPNGINVLTWFQQRLIAAGIQAEPDAVYFSNFLDGSVWDRSTQQLRVGGGEGDRITGLCPWLDFNLVVAMQHSIWLINLDPAQNTSGDESLLVSFYAIKPVHKQIGINAPRTLIQVGSDVWGLTTDGVRSIQRTLAAATQQELGPPISEPIQDIIDRINLNAITKCCAAFRGGRYILSLCLDAATNPNYTAVFNTYTNSWSGYWTGWSSTQYAIRAPDMNTGRLCFGQSDGTVLEWLDYTAVSSEVTATFQDNGIDYPTYILPRAYTCGDLDSPKTGFRAKFEFDKSTAEINIGYIKDAYPSTSTFDDGNVDTSTGTLSLPLTLPFTLPFAGIKPIKLDLMRCGQFNELQLPISSTAGKVSLRSISISAFLDSFVSQSDILT